MIRLGWGAFLGALPEVVSAERWRRMLIVGVLGAVAVGAVLVVTDVLFHWVDASIWRLSVGFALTALGGGALAAAFVRVTPSGGMFSTAGGMLGTAAPRSGPAGDWRAQERLAQYLGWSPPPIRPEDRDMVLADVELGRRMVASSVVHSALGCVGLVFAVAGVLVGGLVADAGFHVPYAFALISAGTVVSQLLTLGRGERARRQAEAIPVQVWGEPAPRPPRGDRPPSAPGSKLSLPDE